MRNVRTRLAVALGVLVAILAVPTGAGAGINGTYVALGDSYTAGPLIPNQIASAKGCFRSDHDYPHLVAAAIVPGGFRDPSCSGADTSDMTKSQSVAGGTNAPEFNSLNSTTTLVTLQIGGNDIGFVSIILHCVSVLPWGSPCKNHYVHNGVDAIANSINATAPKVAAVISGIHARAPHAKVYVLGYPAILPNSGGGCWPKMPITSSDVGYLRSKEQQLNAMIAAQAATHGATYVNVYAPSIGHDACSGRDTRWIEPVIPTHLAAPVHPNETGEQGMAHAVRAAMGL
jgi:lysophospholipase L1-like esterase